MEEDEVGYRLVARSLFRSFLCSLQGVRVTRWVANMRTLWAPRQVYWRVHWRELLQVGASWDGICGEYIYMVESVSRECHLRLLWHGASQRP